MYREFGRREPARPGEYLALEDLGVSVCAVLLAEACHTGLELLVRHETQRVRRDRLSWVSQHYLRDETVRAATVRLVAAHTGIPWARAWGGGEVASADGLRFVVPGRTVHAGAPPQVLRYRPGVTSYNLVSDQCTGLHGITVPGTLRDSLVLLAVALEQQTALQPTQIMTDTGGLLGCGVRSLPPARRPLQSAARPTSAVPAAGGSMPGPTTARVTAWHATPSTSTESPTGGRYVADGRLADTRARTGHRYHAHAAGGGSATAPGAGVRGVRTDRQDNPHVDVPRR